MCALQRAATVRMQLHNLNEHYDSQAVLLVGEVGR